MCHLRIEIVARTREIAEKKYENREGKKSKTSTADRHRHRQLHVDAEPPTLPLPATSALVRSRWSHGSSHARPSSRSECDLVGYTVRHFHTNVYLFIFFPN